MSDSFLAPGTTEKMIAERFGDERDPDPEVSFGLPDGWKINRYGEWVALSEAVTRTKKHLTFVE
jgi:hypothetical protein